MRPLLHCSIITSGLDSGLESVMMPGLGETTAMLARLRKAATRTAQGAAPSGRLVETGAFGENPGALRRLSYVPSGLGANAPLVVVLHGCTQDAEGHAISSGWIALADRLGFAVLAPEQRAANNPNRCFNWFEPGDTTRGQGEAASIAAMITATVREHGCDPRRVFVTGLSAGGAMTAVMLATYPELFAGGAIVAGLAYGVARGVPDALRVMARGDGRPAAALGDLVRRGDAPPLRLAIWHGDADHTVNVANAQDLVGQWTAATGLAGVPAERVTTGIRTRSTWRGQAGGSIVELNIVHGLGHGTPLSTRSDGDVGQPAPYMLEVGLSSTLEIARLWGLSEDGERAETSAPRDKAQPKPSPETKPNGVAAQVLDAVSAHVPPEVRDVIAKALRAAGLMR